jgi:alkylation response protein AidB-like acyl-CoA dehydrogenase
MLLLSAHMLGQVPLLLSADPLLIGRRLIPGVRRNLTGDPYLFAFAITEPDAGSDVEEGHGAALGHPGVVARRVTGGWLLNGRKVFISGGDIAQGFTLFAALDGEGYESWTCFFIERGSPGFRPVRTELKMGMRASGAAELELLDVFVPDADVVGKVRGGWSLNRQTLNISRIPVAAMAVGFAQAACDIAVDHVTRSDGGRARIHDQSVQLAVADMITATSAIRAQVWAAASGWRLRQSTGAMAKFYATDTAMGVIEQGMDLLGPDALLHHNGLEKVWRDCRLTQIFEGTNQINRLAVIEDLQYGFLEPSTTRSQP